MHIQVTFPFCNFWKTRRGESIFPIFFRRCGCEPDHITIAWSTFCALFILLILLKDETFWIFRKLTNFAYHQGFSIADVLCNAAQVKLLAGNEIFLITFVNKGMRINILCWTSITFVMYDQWNYTVKSSSYNPWARLHVDPQS